MKTWSVLVWKCFLLMGILRLPHKEKGSWGSIVMSVAGQEGISEGSIHSPGPVVKEWRLNTNFDNTVNWQGLAGHENCSKNIYEFPAWYETQFVVTLPNKFIGKQIILPVNGHFVFREGSTTFSPTQPSSASQGSDECRGREVKFLRSVRADWHDPDNWLHRDNMKMSSDGNSLLLEPTSAVITPSSDPIPHVERVPCQFDSVRFPSDSSFNLKISSNVTIANFFLGDKKQSYTEIAIMMNSPLGKLQFQKKAETVFSISSGNSPDAACSGKNEEIRDSDGCICSNYGDKQMKQKICALADCSEEIEGECPNPFTPHGFCCPICGFHLKLQHSGNLKLVPLHSKLRSELTKAKLDGKVQIHLARYKAKYSHLIITPASPLPQTTSDQSNDLLLRIGKLVVRIQSILRREEREVIGVTLTESWGDLLPSGESTRAGSSDRLDGSGLGGGLITLIVILVLAAILAGLALFIFIWNKKTGYPPLSLSSVRSSFPRMPSIRIPIVPGSGGRRSSTLSNSLQSFGFARFTNERISSVTIGRPEADKEEDSNQSKSSSIRRAEQVDDEPLPDTSTQMEGKVTDVNAGFGFSDVSYDLVAGVGEDEQVVKMKPVATTLLTIPEVVVVDMDDEISSTSGNIVATPSAPQPPSSSQEKGNKGESSKSGKFKPSFIAARMGSAYKKLAPQGDDDEKDQDNKGKEKSGESLQRMDEKKGKEADENTNNQKKNENSSSMGSVGLASDSGQLFETDDVFELKQDSVAQSGTTETAPANVEEEKIIDI